MTYIRVKWNHKHENEPIVLYSELDEGRMEVRKVEVFRDGRVGRADVDASVGETRLGEEPAPSLEEIAKDPQFDPEEITREDFEMVWKGRN